MVRVLAFVLAVFCAVLSLPARADIATVQNSGTISGIGRTKPLFLSGQSNCSVVFSGNGAGIAATPQASSDNTSTWTTASNINNGSITANGPYIGSVASSGTTAFSVNVTALTSGTINYVQTCTAQVPTTTGTINTNCVSGCSGAPLGLAMNCTAAGANTLACVNNVGTTVCVNNAATQTCTVTNTTAFLGMQNLSGSTEPAGFQCFNSASTTPPNGAFLGGAPSGAPLGASQILTAPGGSGITAANITCVVSGGTALLNTGGVQVYYR